MEGKKVPQIIWMACFMGFLVFHLRSISPLPLDIAKLFTPFLFSELAVEDKKKTRVEKKSSAFFPQKCVFVSEWVCVCVCTELIMR